MLKALSSCKVNYTGIMFNLEHTGVKWKQKLCLFISRSVTWPTKESGVMNIYSAVLPIVKRSLKELSSETYACIIFEARRYSGDWWTCSGAGAKVITYPISLTWRHVKMEDQNTWMHLPHPLSQNKPHDFQSGWAARWRTRWTWGPAWGHEIPGRVAQCSLPQSHPDDLLDWWSQLALDTGSIKLERAGMLTQWLSFVKVDIIKILYTSCCSYCCYGLLLFNYVLYVMRNNCKSMPRSKTNPVLHQILSQMLTKQDKLLLSLPVTSCSIKQTQKE